MKTLNFIQNGFLGIMSIGLVWFGVSAYESRDISSTSFMNNNEVSFAKRLDDSNDDVVLRSVASAPIKMVSSTAQEVKPQVEVNLSDKLVNGRWEVVRAYIIKEKFDDEQNGAGQVVELEWKKEGNIKVKAAWKNIATNVDEIQKTGANNEDFKVSFFNFENKNRMAFFKKLNEGYFVVEVKKLKTLRNPSANGQVSDNDSDALADTVRNYKLESVQIGGDVFKSLNGEARFSSKALESFDVEVPGRSEKISIHAEEVAGDQIIYNVNGENYTAVYYKSENKLSITLVNGVYAQYKGQFAQIKFNFVDEEEVIDRERIENDNRDANVDANTTTVSQDAQIAQVAQGSASEERALAEAQAEAEREKMIKERHLDAQRVDMEINQNGVAF